MRIRSLALTALLVLGVTACTGRTQPSDLPLAPTPAPADAGLVDGGTLPSLDASIVQSYAPCGQLDDCPAGTVRCTLERLGMCNPPCNADSVCPTFEGKEGLCVGDGTSQWCILPCGDDSDCPGTLGCGNGGTCLWQ